MNLNTNTHYCNHPLRLFLNKYNHSMNSENVEDPFVSTKETMCSLSTPFTKRNPEIMLKRKSPHCQNIFFTLLMTMTVPL